MSRFGNGDEDTLKFEILNDGTIKLTSDPISGPNHANATEFFSTIARLAGGEITQEKRTDKVQEHGHSHEHGHKHKH